MVKSKHEDNRIIIIIIGSVLAFISIALKLTRRQFTADPPDNLEVKLDWKPVSVETEFSWGCKLNSIGDEIGCDCGVHCGNGGGFCSDIQNRYPLLSP